MVSCLLSLETVVDTVLMSNLLHTLPRHSLSSDIYGRQIMHLGVCSSYLFFLGPLADLMSCQGTHWPQGLQSHASPFPEICPIATDLA